MRRALIPILGLLIGCGDGPLPKPKGYLRLEYPNASYRETSLPLPFTFEKNAISEPISKLKTSGTTKGVDIKYPSLKATIYLNYKEVVEETGKTGVETYKEYMAAAMPFFAQIEADIIFKGKPQAMILGHRCHLDRPFQGRL